MSFVYGIKLSEVPVGSMKTVIIANKPIAIVNIDGQYFAIDDSCTHEHCSLGAEGLLDGSTIVCGCHGAQFDVATGRVVMPPATINLNTYETREDGEDLLINL